MHSKSIHFLRFVWRLTHGRIIWGGFVSLLVGLTEGLSLVLIVPIIAVASSDAIDRIYDLPVVGQFSAGDLPDLKALLVIFVLLIALQSLFSRFKSLFNQKILYNAADSMRQKLFAKVGMAQWEKIRHKRGSDLNHILTRDTERVTAAIGNGLTLFHNTVMLGIYLGLAALISWQMALFATLVGGGLFLILFPIRRMASKYGREMTKLYETQNHTVLEFINSLHLVKSFVVEDVLVSRYTQHLREMRKSVFEYLSISSFGSVAFQIGSAIAAALFVWLAIELFTLDIARISVLILIFIRLAPKFNIIQEAIQQYLTNAPAYENYENSLEYFSTNQESDPELKLTPPVLTEAIALKNLSVTFPDVVQPALNKINIKIYANRITALIGPSGSGKSTLADILIGLTSPDEGGIFIDAFPLLPSYRRSWRATTAYVSQEAMLINDTIEANLVIGNKTVTHQEMWNALERAQIADLIKSLPNGLQTVVQDRGNRFSGGERQRLTLARALLKRPQLLVLDEATSALDWENQNKVADVIKSLRGELTIVTIAHRPSLITFADDVIALEGGRIVEQGSFKSLRSNPESTLTKMIVGEEKE